MKKYLATIVAFFIAFFAFSYDLDFHFVPVENGEQGVKIYYDIPDIFEELSLEEDFLQDVRPDRSFRTKFDGKAGEVHFMLFADTGVSDENFKSEVNVWNSLILKNIAGKSAFRPMKYYEGPQANNFNSDYLGMTIIGNPTSDFARGKKIAFVESAYKKNVGILMRVFLTDDIAFLGYEKDGKMRANADFFRFYGTSCFYDEDFAKDLKKGFPQGADF